MYSITTERRMRLLLALILQITLIGWVPAAIWSVYALSQYKTDEKIQAALAGRNRG
ncbi:membrane protein [Ensifer adhaerens]|uniref:Membrane protein n=1 Tax=Ensifer adhaerens TaxID=106592 RepID=A0A0L8BLJ5_ENSAD|nr:membrane protein [Ensifer adhaerens]